MSGKGLKVFIEENLPRRSHNTLSGRELCQYKKVTSVLKSGDPSVVAYTQS